MMREFPISMILRDLSRDNLLPGILFRSSRKQCDADLESLVGNPKAELPPAQQETILKEIDAVIAKYNMEPAVIRDHPQYQVLMKTGCGAHHAGQLLLWRLLLEELMTRSLLRILVATGTVAAGVDFPARTVIITAHSKRGSGGFNILTSSEFQQMSGRAGRRGKDAVGICLVAPTQFLDARLIYQVATRPPEPLKSSYFAAPSTILNLLKYRNVDDLNFTVRRSLASFMDKKESVNMLEHAAAEDMLNQGRAGESRKKGEKRVRRMQKEAEDVAARQMTQVTEALAGLTRLGHVENGRLTEKGAWAAELYTSLVLELAEAVDGGLLHDLSAPQLAGIVGSIAGDTHRTYLTPRKGAQPIGNDLFEDMQRVVDVVHAKYPLTRTDDVGVVPDAAFTVITWMTTSSWPEFAALLRLFGVAEGDAARLITQTADHLNQLTRLHKSHPTLAVVAGEAREKLMRPPLTEVVG